MQQPSYPSASDLSHHLSTYKSLHHYKQWSHNRWHDFQHSTINANMNYMNSFRNYNNAIINGSLPLAAQDLPTTGKVDKKDVSQWDQFENAGVAFLGPQLWEKTIPCDSDLKLEYMDLDEFLNAKNIDDELLKRTMGGLTSSSPAHANAPHPHPHPHPHPETPTTHSSEQSTDLSLLATNLAIGISHESSSPNSSKSSCSSPTDRNQGVDYPSSLKSDSKSPMSPSSSVSDYKEDFDPRTHTFSEDELKPQPMTKKSQKQYIPHEMKDDRYWQRRRKNNMAAKRSRDARRMKENQIALRACYLEKENNNLRSELDKTRTMLEVMKKRLATYESTE